MNHRNYLPIFLSLSFLQGCGGSGDDPGQVNAASLQRSSTNAKKMASVNSATNPCAPDGCDVILLTGQSNMVGWNGGSESDSSNANPDARVLQWNEATQSIELATDAMNWTTVNPTQNSVRPAGSIGPALSFGKAYARSLLGNRKVLLVPAAAGGTGFYRGNWTPPSTGVAEGSLVTNAINIANHAMSVASNGTSTKLAGILWQQGECDVNDASYGGSGPANAYQNSLLGLIDTFRSRITGGTVVTGGQTTYVPFVVGEMSPQFVHWNNGTVPPPPLSDIQLQTKASILRVFHALPVLRQSAAWVSSGGLQSNASGAGDVHFEKDSQRQLGLRYADKLFEASNGLPEAAISLKYWNGSFVNIGPDMDLGQTLPASPTPTIVGQVIAVKDAQRGWVAKVVRSAGSIQFTNLPPSLVNTSYSKSAWLKLDGYGYSNNLVSGTSTNQSHAFYFPNQSAGFVAAGHNSAGISRTDYVKSSSQVPADGQTWVHLIVTYDSATHVMALYVNGVLSASAQNVPKATTETATTTVQLSAYGSYANTGVNGEMIDNQLYTSALTAQQVALIYEHELSYRAGF